MPLITASKTAPRYDAIIVGSGAAGGMSAYVLTKAGMKVLMLEAGRNYEPAKETPMFQTNADAPLRAASTPEKPNGFFDATIGGGWVVDGEPYVVQKKSDDSWKVGEVQNRTKTDQNFMWWRSRALGGRTNHWGRVSLRMGDYDFKPKSRDGLGVDWPIGYEDVAPYYDLVDQVVGIYGEKAGIENAPDSDFFQPPPKPRAYELLLKKSAEKLGIRITAARMAILTRAINGRAACFYATPCGRGCAIGAAFQSTTALLPPAMDTGNLDLVTDAMVREITVDAEGRATGVHFIDKATGQEMHVKGRAVLLGASAMESTRILLNSKSPKHPAGLGNSSGHLGRWLTDSVGAELGGQIPALENLPIHNEDGTSTFHTYAPWWPYKDQLAGKLGFPRGYYFGYSGGRSMPGANVLLPDPNAYGRKLKEDARRYFGTQVSFHARGEMIPNEKSWCELDPQTKDRWGIPVLRFHFQWSDYELKQAVHMQQTFAQVIEGMGGKVNGKVATDGSKIITAGGSVNHEMGTARMAATAKEGVVNSWSQIWDAPNVFVVDGAAFPSGPHKNPTITIMALAWRACDYLMGEMKKGNIG
jgi:choline dehydrogenase-like flavoprotein